MAQDYLDAVKPVMRVTGLVFPTRQELLAMGTETASDVDLTL